MPERSQPLPRVAAAREERGRREPESRDSPAPLTKWLFSHCSQASAGKLSGAEEGRITGGGADPLCASLGAQGRPDKIPELFHPGKSTMLSFVCFPSTASRQCSLVFLAVSGAGWGPSCASGVFSDYN